MKHLLIVFSMVLSINLYAQTDLDGTYWLQSKNSLEEIPLIFIEVTSLDTVFSNGEYKGWSLYNLHMGHEKDESGAFSTYSFLELIAKNDQLQFHFSEIHGDPDKGIDINKEYKYRYRINGDTLTLMKEGKDYILIKE